MDIIDNGIDTYSGYYFVDLIMILDDIIMLLKDYKDERFKLYEIKGLFSKLKHYIYNNNFYRQNYKMEISKLINIIKNVDKLISNSISLKKEITYIYESINNSDNMKLLSDTIQKEVYSNKDLNSCKKNLQSLAIDYISCLIRNGFKLDYLKSKIFNVDYSEFLKDPEDMRYYPKKQLTRPIREFNSFINRANDEEKEILYIFKIKGLKIIMPFKINDIIFYNPLRGDLLQWQYNLSIMDSEYFLLNDIEKEILDIYVLNKKIQ